MTDGTETGQESAAEAPAAELAQVAAWRAKLVQAELRTAAVQAGMVDLDGVKLIDTAGLTVTDAGVLEGAGAIMERMRETKPWLFGRASSSSGASVPRASTPKPKTAMQMSEAEWRAARDELLRRR